MNKFFLTLQILILFVKFSAFGCGPRWDMITDHFPGVQDEGGYVNQWEKIGSIPLTDEGDIPLYIQFNSFNERTSPYLGKSWSLSLLESHVEQIDDSTFQLFEPGGRFRYFTRDKKEPSILSGQGGWKGQIRGETIVFWADCGWKMVYEKGKIASIGTPKNKTLDFIYAGERVVSIRETKSGQNLLIVQNDEKIENKLSIQVGGKLLEVELGQKPQIQSIGGKYLVGGMDKSLVCLRIPNRDTLEYSYGVTDLIEPTIKIGADLVVWDPETKQIKRQGSDSFKIFPRKNRWDMSRIEKIDSSNAKEIWDYNEELGTETIVSKDGVKIVKSWFTSGVASGSLRKIERVKGDTVVVEMRAIYDEKGNLIRQYISDPEVVENNHLNSFVKEGEVLVSEVRNSKDGKITASAEDYSKDDKSDENGKLLYKVERPGVGTLLVYLGKDGKLMPVLKKMKL